MAIDQTLTPPTTAPARDQAKSVFDTNIDNRLAWDANNTTELTTWQGEANALSVVVNQNAVDAAAAATSAVAASDFIGEWAAQTGAKTVPTSVAHNGETWILLSDIADISLKEPGVASEWLRTASTSLARSYATSLVF